MHTIGQVPAALNMAGPWQDSHYPETQGNAQPGQRATQSHFTTMCCWTTHLSERCPGLVSQSLGAESAFEGIVLCLVPPSKIFSPHLWRFREVAVAGHCCKHGMCRAFFRCTDQRRLPGASLSAAGALLSTAALVEVSTLTAQLPCRSYVAPNMAESTTTSVSAPCHHQQWRTNAHAPMCDGFLHAGTYFAKKDRTRWKALFHVMPTMLAYLGSWRAASASRCGRLYRPPLARL